MIPSKNKWAFFSYGHNLGDFTRAVETAVEMQQTGASVQFYNHGSVHLQKIKNRGLNCVSLYPELSWEQHEIIMDIGIKLRLEPPFLFLKRMDSHGRSRP